jgi:hypothetical protein
VAAVPGDVSPTPTKKKKTLKAFLLTFDYLENYKICG